MRTQRQSRLFATYILVATNNIISSHCAQAYSALQSAYRDNDPRRLEIAKDESDEYASASLNLLDPPAEIPKIGINKANHAKIKSMLMAAREIMENAKVLFECADKRSVAQALEMMKEAGAIFQQAKGHIHLGREENLRGQDQSGALRGATGTSESEERERKVLQTARSKFSHHDLSEAKEDEDRALDIARNMWETFITFPECLEQLFEKCVEIINNDLEDLGISTIEVVVHEKRNLSQEGYNKVVIVTNELADRVKGRSGDGIVSYPFQWDDQVLGSRTLGVDGKWDCRESTPDECCATIKQSVPNKDVRGNNIECHIFVPFGGVGNKRRNDRVFINLSPDGRVHEPPMIA